MRLRLSRREEPDITLTPLIDVVFLLLIFFMVSTTFNRESEISIDLPQASQEPAVSEDMPVELTIDREGRYYVNQQLVVNKTSKALKTALERVIGDGKDPTLLISADAAATHQSVITAMDAARLAGIVHVSLATKKARSGD